MSLPEVESPEPGGRTPVFVDDSGRRRARLRIVVRVVVGILALYLAVAVGSLVVPVSFPIAHLGNLGVLPRHRQNATLGPQSKEAALPAALQPGTGNTQVTSATIGTPQPSQPGSTTPAGGVVSPGQTTPSATTIPTAQTTTVTTTPSANTTTTPPTTGRTTTSTAPHGPSTTRTHGPPSTTPGKGSKP